MEEKRKNSDELPPVAAPCPLCGGTDFRWGTPTSNGGLWFSEDGKMSWGLGGGLRMRACNSCGNVQLFLKEITG